MARSVTMWKATVAEKSKVESEDIVKLMENVGKLRFDLEKLML